MYPVKKIEAKEKEAILKQQKRILFPTITIAIYIDEANSCQK